MKVLPNLCVDGGIMGEAMPARQSRAGFFAGITISMLFDRLPVQAFGF
jgi:hypothetical protein